MAEPVTERGKVLQLGGRCGVVLRVVEPNFSMLKVGEYPCTLSAGHVGEVHACVVRWGEIQFSA